MTSNCLKVVNNVIITEGPMMGFRQGRVMEIACRMGPAPSSVADS